MRASRLKPAGVTARISFRHARRGSTCLDYSTPESFDVIICHNLLEYSESLSTTIRDIANMLRRDGVFSILVRNRNGEVLKDAIKSSDWKLATASLTAETVVDSTLRRGAARIYSRRDARFARVRAGLEVVAECGVRVFCDYLRLRV